MKRFYLVLLIIVLLALAACQPVATEPASDMSMEAAEPSGTVEVFSWWSGGGELAGLNAIIEVFNARYPDVEFDNAAIGGGDGVNMKTVLETRMLGGEPPDSFQVWAGVGVVEDHVVPGRMEGLDFLYSEEGLYDVFPQSVIDNVSYEGTPYVVPVNIHRQNIMWYRLDRFEAAGITEPPTNWEEFFVVAEQLKEAGIPAIGGASLGALAFHTYNYFLNSVTDGETYLGLFDGSVGWDAPEVAEALELHMRAMEYASGDWLEVGWGDQVERFAADYDETPAIILMGDWFWGFIKSEGIEELVGWADIPNHQGKYVWVADSFGLPKNAPNRDNAIAWLKVVASKDGQDAFNPLKGSIPVRTDGDVSLYDEYLRESMDAWQTHELLPFIGGLVRQSFVTDLGNIVNNMLTGHGDVARAQEELIQAAKDSGIGE